jgi:hypothetical protein
MTPLGDHLAGVVGGVLLQDAAQQVAAAGDREPDRERKLGAKRVMVHLGLFWFCSEVPMKSFGTARCQGLPVAAAGAARRPCS